MAPAREQYYAEIRLCRSVKGARISDQALAAWRDAYERAGAARAQVLARHGFGPAGQPLPKENRRAA